MYKAGDTILYGTYGVCRIEEITEKEFMGEKREYYVLKPLSNPKGTLFAPVGSEKAGAKMRRILSPEEVRELLCDLKKEEIRWEEKENVRKEEYRRIIMECNRRELIQMVKEIYFHKQRREAEGKRLYLSDERFFNEAERILYDEFHYILGIQREELLPLILGQV